MKEHYHILSLVVQKDSDIPMVRGKVKLLTRSIGCSRERVACFATAASELARMLLTCCHGGKAKLVFQRSGEVNTETSLELIFSAGGDCRTVGPEQKVLGAQRDELLATPPFPALQRVFDTVELHGGVGTTPLAIQCRSTLVGLPWSEELLFRIKAIRKELFADTEESYMENLRAKHDEVVQLLKEKTEQNRLLDQSNNELLQLSNDLEVMAQERTIIEMSLKIADQVRNPAAVIGGLAKQLLKKGQLPDKVSVKLVQIVEQAEHIDQIVYRFHAMADERRDLFAQQDLIGLVREGLQACPTIGNRAITADFKAGEQPVLIHANRRVLKIALVHILRHAASVTPSGGRLLIRVDSDQENATVTVIDQGAGFSETILDQLHQPVDYTARNGHPGLSLVRQILTEHQGELEVENSTEPGQGGRLVLRFPLFWREQGKSLR